MAAPEAGNNAAALEFAHKLQALQPDNAKARMVLRELLEAETLYGYPEVGRRWDGGTLVLRPADETLQAKELPLDVFFNKIIMLRDRLRVLLVSGEPHQGGRTWRNLLKSDASVDLVHFTILRPPEKQDGVPVTGRVRPLPVLETPPPGEWARRLQMAAVAAFSEDREGEAIELLERALAVWPGHADSYESLGVILGRHERYEEAVALMQRLLDQSVQYRWNAQGPRPPTCLGDRNPSDRLRLIAAFQ